MINLDYKYFYGDITNFVNDNKITSISKYLLVTDIINRYTYVFIKNNDMWSILYKWPCTVGKASTPTVQGVFYVNGRKPYFGTSTYRAKYATRIIKGYYYHSVLYDQSGTKIIDGRLGMALSHGCIRLKTSNAKWIYENIPDKTKIIIH